MDMKKIMRFSVLVSVLAMLASCSDFLTKTPETNLAPESFFKSESELELWTNRFYNLLSEPDNMLTLYADDYVGSSLTNVARGTRTAASESWGTSAWQYLRWINILFEYDTNCDNEAARIKHEGVAYFFRAWFYFEKVKKYGDMPYYDYVISDQDTESLKKPRDSRAYVMYRVMQDLDRAIANLPDAWSSTPLYRLSKDAARALKSRAALFEGTFRKYHGLADETVDGITLSADWFLQQSAAAAGEIIASGKYFLHTGNASNTGPYRDLFILEDADPDETILGRRYASNTETGIKVRHRIQFSLLGNLKISATRRFVNHYLQADGSPIQARDGYATEAYFETFQHRDPRMAQTLRAPGYVQVGEADETVETLKDSNSGYTIIKHVSDSSHNGSETSTTDWAVFRYAEILLNYAEAKAELGTLTQEDIDRTVNVVRARVGMPALSMESANAAPDALMSDYYPNVLGGANKGVLLEIRRERTVELVAEGFRQWDLLRWKEGKFFTPNSYEYKGLEGVWFPGLGEYDMNGDNEPDILLYSGTKPATRLAAYSVDTELILSEGDHGYVLMFSAETYTWNEERDYLWPIPESQRIATGNILSQNYGY